MSKKLFCVDESVYAEHITKRKAYVIGKNFIFLEDLNRKDIEWVIGNLDTQNELLEMTREY